MPAVQLVHSCCLSNLFIISIFSPTLTKFITAMRVELNILVWNTTRVIALSLKLCMRESVPEIILHIMLKTAQMSVFDLRRHN